jgi:hypothetical protein
MAAKPRKGTCFSSGCDAVEEIAIRTTNSRDKAGLVHTIYSNPSDAPETVPGYCADHGAHLAANLAIVHTGKHAAVDVLALLPTTDGI